MKRSRDNKPHIGIFGRRNTGKSSFINALVGQDIAIVSEQAGTTTDPVKKSIEIFGIGPAIIIDTAGIDDVGALGEKRVEKTREVLELIDCAVLMIAESKFGRFEEELIQSFGKLDIPFIIIHNKSDIAPLLNEMKEKIIQLTTKKPIDFSSLKNEPLEKVLNELKETIPESAYQKPSLLAGIVEKGDYVLLITPIDNEAPDGRMILPQVMAIRDVLDNDAINIVLKEDQVENFFKNSGLKPKIAITDSQVFEKMKDIVPRDVLFTSFSILFARFKGDFSHYLEGTPKIDDLKEGDRVLLLESCTHQVNCDDIGRYKIPAWLMKHTGKNLSFDVSAGLDKIPRDMADYSLVIQCGGCMITKRQLSNRLRNAVDKKIPVSNYGMSIAWVNGIFDRVTEAFR